MARAMAKKAETSTTLLEAAKKVLRQSGYAGLSTRDVAAAHPNPEHALEERLVAILKSREIAPLTPAGPASEASSHPAPSTSRVVGMPKARPTALSS